MLLGEAELYTSICQDLYNRHVRIEKSAENVGTPVIERKTAARNTHRPILNNSYPPDSFHTQWEGF